MWCVKLNGIVRGVVNGNLNDVRSYVVDNKNVSDVVLIADIDNDEMSEKYYVVIGVRYVGYVIR